MSNVTITPNAAALSLSGVAANNWPSTGFLYITEFGTMLDDSLSGSGFPHCPPLATQMLAFNSNVSAQSLALSSRTRLVRLSATATCVARVDKAAIATASDMRLVANAAGEYFATHPGDQVAALGSS